MFIMKPKIKKLAEKAGFNLWTDEPWKPGDVIDWSCSYDKELIKFYKLVMKKAKNENRN
jgi:hypothetical protein